MNWALFRWVWQLEGPLYVGMPPAGSLNRTRLYVPARTLWGALTAELARRETAQGKEPQYQLVGECLKKDYRFTYLFPAQKIGAAWMAWLPRYERGLCWQREDATVPFVNERSFRRRLLSTRPGTAIDATTDAADEGTLRETECIQTRWRNDRGQDEGPVAMLGYVFIRVRKAKAKAKDKYPSERMRLDSIDTLFVGGDTRYGLGRLRRASFELADKNAFGQQVTLDQADPIVNTSSVWAHARAASVESGALLSGALELVSGWDCGAIRSLDSTEPMWQPGSALTASEWTINPDGTWTVRCGNLAT